MVESIQLEQIRNMVEIINDNLDELSKYLDKNKIDYKASLLNLEMKSDGENKYYKELRMTLDIIERIGKNE